LFNVDALTEPLDRKLDRLIAAGTCKPVIVAAPDCFTRIGGNPRSLRDLDVRMIGAVLSRNGSIVETGVSGAVLGNPATAVAWLANKVHAFGVSLEPGNVIMPGSCTRAIDVKAGDEVRVEFAELGHVSVRFS